MKVFVYFNLHKGLWSIRAEEGPHKGKVVAHASQLSLSDCTFKVSEAGRQRVLREKRKNVHAGVHGQLNRAQFENTKIDDIAFFTPKNINEIFRYTREVFDKGLLKFRKVMYNPYKYDSFVHCDDESSIQEARAVIMFDDRTVIAY